MGLAEELKKVEKEATKKAKEEAKTAGQDAAVQKAAEFLLNQRSQLAVFDDLLSKAWTGLYVIDGDDCVVVPPFNAHGRTGVEQGLLEDLTASLQSSFGDVKEETVYGLQGLRVTLSDIPLAGQLELNYDGVPVTLKFLEVGLPLRESIPGKKTPKKAKKGGWGNKIDFGSLAHSEYHVPDVQLGEEIVLPLATVSNFKYSLFYVRRDVRLKWPGFHVPFIVQYDGKQVTTHVVNAKGALIGSNKGSYFNKGLKGFFRDHADVIGTSYDPNNLMRVAFQVRRIGDKTGEDADNLYRYEIVRFGKLTS